jgi:WD40 repeat protein
MQIEIEQIAKLPMHQGAVYSLEKGEDENKFFSAGGEGIVIKWNVQQLDKPTAVAKVDGQIFSLCFLSKKNHLLIGTMSGGLHVIDLNLKKEIHYITFHQQSVFDIKLLEEKIFVASKDGTLSVWSAGDYQLERVINISNAALRTIEFNLGKKEATIGCSDHKIYLLDVEHWKINAILEAPENSVFSLCYLENKNELLAGSRDAQLYVFDSKQHQLKQQLKAHLYTINHILKIEDAQLIATAARDKTIRIWDAETFTLLKSIDKMKLNGHINSVNKLLWFPLHHYLVSCSDDRSVIIWKINLVNE